MIDIGTGKIFMGTTQELFSGGKKGFGGFVSSPCKTFQPGEDGGDDAQTAFDLV